VALLRPLRAQVTGDRPEASRVESLHLRRCTYRRMVAVRRRPQPVYDVECLYPDRQAPLPLGDLSSARPICEACRAEHIFRPDED
jgi:hypothetical protein